jgi:predicted transcriptional regulator
MRQEGKHDEEVDCSMSHTVTLPDDIYEQVAALAERQGQPVDAVVAAALARGLEQPSQLAANQESRAIAMREMDLTPEEATELRERIEHPTAFPKRTPHDLPEGDSSLLH